MKNYETLITAYATDVTFPDISGIEHLHMLMRRSEIAHNESYLTEEQRQRLHAADAQLIQQARIFYRAIQAIADLSNWRQNQNITINQWWWYLDVLAQLPSFSPTVIQQPMAA